MYSKTKKEKYSYLYISMTDLREYTTSQAG